MCIELSPGPQLKFFASEYKEEKAVWLHKTSLIYIGKLILEGRFFALRTLPKGPCSLAWPDP